MSKKEVAKWEKVRTNYPQGDLVFGPYFRDQMETGHILFVLSRYKFAYRLLEGKDASVLELGCTEGVGTSHIAKVAQTVTGIDFDKEAIDWARKHRKKTNLTFLCEDFMGKTYGSFDAVISLDVIEHIPPKREDKFLSTVHANLKPSGFAIIGTPNKTASRYASKASKDGHVNLYDAQRLQSSLSRYFHNVFMFGMNDEIVHTGFKPMTHYLMALACHKK